MWFWKFPNLESGCCLAETSPKISEMQPLSNGEFHRGRNDKKEKKTQQQTDLR